MVFTIAMLVAAILATDVALPLWAAMAVAVAVATAVGAFTGMPVVLTRANSLIVSLSMMILLRGITEALTEGSTVMVTGADAALLRQFSNQLLYGTLPILCLAVIAAIVWYVTEMTPLGRCWHAIGGSPEATDLRPTGYRRRHRGQKHDLRCPAGDCR